MTIEYYIARWYREIKEQTGIEDERAAATLAAAYQIAVALMAENGTTIPEALIALANNIEEIERVIGQK